MWKRPPAFEIKELLGEGSQGRVYKALRRDRAADLSQTVAVKILHSETAVGAWKSEFDSLAKVRSPYCVQVFGFERIRRRPALILEFVDGVSLSTLGKGCWLEADDITEILAQCEAAVLDLYKFGTFHGDLSPQNILVDRDGHLRLLDFGLANCGAGLVRATPEFAAPERLCGEAASLAGDIFSLGRIEQFLQGRASAADSKSTYLQSNPEKRSLRGIFSQPERRKKLAAKVRAYQERQLISRDFRTRTQTLITSAIKARPVPTFLALISAALLFVIPSAGRSSVPAKVAALQIQTHRWHYFRLDGVPIGYSPLNLPLEPGQSYKLEWTSQNHGGARQIVVEPGRTYRYSDRDFSH